MTLDPIIRAGAEMANLLYNLEQTSFGSPEIRASMKEAQTAWDAARRAYLEAAPSGQAPLEGVKAIINRVLREHAGPEHGLAIGEGGCPRVDWYALRNELVAALIPASAEPVAHPLAAFPDGIVPGLYIVHWKSGGTSKAAIGMLPNGNRWIAPTNWVRPGTWPAADEWHDIDHVEPVLADDPPASGAVEAGWQQDCATEGCSNAAGVYFERGGVGSHYCGDCYLRVQAIPAAPTEGR